MCRGVPQGMPPFEIGSESHGFRYQESVAFFFRGVQRYLNSETCLRDVCQRGRRLARIMPAKIAPMPKTW